jgi:hypothetical protein
VCGTLTNACRDPRLKRHGSKVTADSGAALGLDIRGRSEGQEGAHGCAEMARTALLWGGHWASLCNLTTALAKVLCYLLKIKFQK